MTNQGNKQTKGGFLSRLLHDTTANVLVMTAASVIPMVILSGSAIDISRVYLAKSRLQAACDAGVLAGRKAMTTVTYTTSAQNRANAMFNFNYQAADYSATNTSFNATADNLGKLTGVAQTRVPMMIVDIIGIQKHDLTVRCSADVQVPNIDIVFVLDVTGSMDDSINGTKKINSLKSATIGFYDTMAAALAGNTRSQIRYGFVPYSQAVNASELFSSSADFNTLGQLPLTHLSSNMTVQSRVANFNTPVVGGWVADPASSPLWFDQTFASGNGSSAVQSRLPNQAAAPTGTVMSNNDCEQYGSNLSFSIDNSTNLQVWFPTRTSWPGGAGMGDSVLYQPDGSTTWQATRPTTGNSYIEATFERLSGTWTDNNGAQTGNYRVCQRRVTHTRYIRQDGYKLTNWTYRPVTLNVANYKAGSGMSYVSDINANDAVVTTAGSYNMQQLAQLSNRTGMTTSTATWNGCLEERPTTSATNFAPIPSAAKDLDYLSDGTTSGMQWNTVIPALTYMRNGTASVTTSGTSGSTNKPEQTCPTASMRNLRTYGTRADFVSYVNTLSPNGFTYLDVGMVWGLRLIAPQGMFSQRNLTGPNGGQISRHIFFLTDGEPVSEATTYSAYGTEQMERRITGSTGVSAATLHSRRFQALCDAERGRVNIWAIAFGTSVTGNLTNCADSGRAMQANNTAQLNAAFTRIANEVADLRLVE